MLRICLIAVTCILVTLPAFAGRKKEKAGTLTDGVYSDESYAFNMKIPAEWKARIQDDKKPLRVVLSRGNFDIPPDYQETPDNTKAPRIVVFADTTSFAALDFIDSLVSPTFKSAQKKTVMAELEIFHAGQGSSGYVEEALPRKRSIMKFGENPGAIWSGQAKYMKEVSTSASSVGGKRVTSAYAGTIVTVKSGKTIVLFHLITEANYHASHAEELNAIVASLNWQGGTASGG